MDNSPVQQTRKQTQPSKVILKILSRTEDMPATMQTTKLSAQNKPFGYFEETNQHTLETKFHEQLSEKKKSKRSIKNYQARWMCSKKKFQAKYKMETIQENESESDDHQPVKQDTRPRPNEENSNNASSKRPSNSEVSSVDNESESDMKARPTLRQILQGHQSQREPPKDTNTQVRHTATTPLMNDRFTEIARTIAATSSTANQVAGGSMTTSPVQEVRSSMFENQVRPPKEAHTGMNGETNRQTGAAAPLKNIRADNGFIGDHVKPPIRPPSTGPTVSPEFDMIFQAMQSEDRSGYDEVQIVDDPLAALTALLRPKELTRRKPEECNDASAADGEADRKALIPTCFPPYPVVEVHALIERPEWAGQPMGKSVRCNNPSTEWQAAETRHSGKRTVSQDTRPRAPVETRAEYTREAPAPIQAVPKKDSDIFIPVRAPSNVATVACMNELSEEEFNALGCIVPILPLVGLSLRSPQMKRRHTKAPPEGGECIPGAGPTPATSELQPSEGKGPTDRGEISVRLEVDALVPVSAPRQSDELKVSQRTNRGISPPTAKSLQGTPPTAQAAGRGSTDESVGRNRATGRGGRRRPDNRDMRTWKSNGAGGNDEAQTLAPPPPSPVSTSLRDVLKGNSFAALACEPEIEEVLPPAAARQEPKATKARTRAPGPRSQGEQERKPHTLADHVPAGGNLVSRESEKKRRKELRRQRRQSARQKRATSHEQRGGLEPIGLDGTVSAHVPGGFRTRHANLNRASSPFTVAARTRKGCHGLRGCVSDRISVLPMRVKKAAERERPKLRPVWPERVSCQDLVRREGEMTGLVLEREAEHNKSQPDIATRRPKSMKTAGDVHTRTGLTELAEPVDGSGAAQLSPRDLAEQEREEASSARLQLEVDLGGRSVAVQVRESDLRLVSPLTMASAEKTIECVVTMALKRALGLDKSAGLSMEPTLNGRRPDDGELDSWETLERFVRNGGQYKANRRLRGGAAPEQARATIVADASV